MRPSDKMTDADRERFGAWWGKSKHGGVHADTPWWLKDEMEEVYLAATAAEREACAAEMDTTANFAARMGDSVSAKAFRTAADGIRARANND